MRNATIAFVLAVCLAGTAWAQQKTEYELIIPVSDDTTAGYVIDLQSGARSVTGPYDLDGDMLYEILVTDYTGGGRVHVIENVGPDMWELVYSTPYLDATPSSQNGRIAKGANLDNDAFGEIVVPCGWDYAEDVGKLIVPNPGICVWEHTGVDNDWGMTPASVYDYVGDPPTRSRHEVIEVVDVDADGFQELLFATESPNDYDRWWVASVTGDIGSGFEAWNNELIVSSRTDATGIDPVSRGGGSPYGILAGDVDGDGAMEIGMSSWNNFNFTNARATAPDTYQLPAEGDPGLFLQASPDDHVSLFGGVATDINGDGDVEMYWPRYQSFGTGAVSMLNYEAGENGLSITEENFKLDLLEDLTNFGITAGDLDGDGMPELIGAGDNSAYTAAKFDKGESAMEIAVAKFMGGDVEDPANYEISTWNTSVDGDTLTFDTVIRDSAGVITRYHEGILGLSTKMTYLGDADMDGFVEVALSYQTIPDSVSVIDEVWTEFTADSSAYERTVRETAANSRRVFMRVLSTDGATVAITDERIILPSEYKLDGNYPNPFNPITTISFTLPLDKQVSVNVYDISGRLVKSLVDSQFLSKGTHQVTWDGTDVAGSSVASGTYLYSLEYGNFRQTRKMVLLK